MFRKLADGVLAARGMRAGVVTQRERARMLQKHLLLAWKDRRVALITRRQVVYLVEVIARRGAPVVPNRTLGLIRPIFNDGLRMGFPTPEANPAHLVEPLAGETGRHRYRTRRKIGFVWQAMDDETRETCSALQEWDAFVRVALDSSWLSDWLGQPESAENLARRSAPPTSSRDTVHVFHPPHGGTRCNALTACD